MPGYLANGTNYSDADYDAYGRGAGLGSRSCSRIPLDENTGGGAGDGVAGLPVIKLDVKGFNMSDPAEVRGGPRYRSTSPYSRLYAESI